MPCSYLSLAQGRCLRHHLLVTPERDALLLTKMAWKGNKRLRRSCCITSYMYLESTCASWPPQHNLWAAAFYLTKNWLPDYHSSLTAHPCVLPHRGFLPKLLSDVFHFRRYPPHHLRLSVLNSSSFRQSCPFCGSRRNSQTTLWASFAASRLSPLLLCPTPAKAAARCIPNLSVPPCCVPSVRVTRNKQCRPRNLIIYLYISLV
jgi:hypothetical protein